MGHNCEYCKEIAGVDDQTFSQIYKKTKSRVILEHEGFIVIPTLGQLFKHSLLILPKVHVESFAQFEKDNIEILSQLLQRIETILAQYGSVVAFEHGASSKSGGGCGIYHAHLHVVPLPSEVNMFNFLHEIPTVYENIAKGLEAVKESSEYLLAVNSDGVCGALDIQNSPRSYPSQFFRRKLAEHFNVDRPWDWREYKEKEKWLLSTIEELPYKLTSMKTLN